MVREVIAKRVIEIAGRGGRDPDKMCEAALTSLGVMTGAYFNSAGRTKMKVSAQQV